MKAAEVQLKVERPGRLPRVLLGCLAVTGVGQTLLYAVLPLASRSALALSGAQSSMVFALSSILWSAFSPVWGRRADRGGAGRVLAMGMVGQAVSNLAVGSAFVAAQRGVLGHWAVFPLLLLLRGINGVFGCGVLPAAQSLALRGAPGRERIAVVGTVTASWSIGTMAGPGFAAILAPLGMAAPLLCAAAASGGAAVFLGLRAQSQPDNAVEVTRPPAFGMIRRRIWGFMLMQLGLGVANSVVAQSTGFFVQDRLGLTAGRAVAVAGLGLSALAACSVAAQMVAVRVRPAPHVLMQVGAAGAALAAVALVLWPGPAMLVAALGAMGAGFGVATLGSSATASLLTRANQQGAVAGTLTSAGSLGAVFSALLIMPFYERFNALPYVSVAVLTLCVLAGSFVAPRPGGR